MSESASRLRQQLWLAYRALARTLRALQRDAPMVQGSLYLLRRQCGKPTCRCARGHLHATWVLTRSEAGKSRLYSVPPDQRGPLRPLAREYRRWQRARAQLVKQSVRLVALIDQLADQRLQAWPPPPPDGPGPG
ncbi:MAG: hypothetical protein HW378_4906 [Anaerolineales bacterium]|nr:hypothetical protein [Anaerolineales bacterium]